MDLNIVGKELTTAGTDHRISLDLVQDDDSLVLKLSKYQDGQAVNIDLSMSPDNMMKLIKELRAKAMSMTHQRHSATGCGQICPHYRVGVGGMGSSYPYCDAHPYNNEIRDLYEYGKYPDWCPESKFLLKTSGA